MTRQRLPLPHRRAPHHVQETVCAPPESLWPRQNRCGPARIFVAPPESWPANSCVLARSGVGPTTGHKLTDMGVTTVRQLRALSKEMLQKQLGEKTGQVGGWAGRAGRAGWALCGCRSS